MTDPLAAMNAMMEQSRVQFQEQSAVKRAEAQKTASFDMEMQRLQHERGLENEISRRMNSIIADMLTSLKKTGTEIRQSS